MVLDLPGGLFEQSDVRETPAGTSSSTSSSTIIAPIGTILPWLKSFTNTPQALPTGWMEADGSAISDAESVYDGQNAPDLNGGEFIRGAATSGGTGGSDTMAHTHTTNVTIDNHNAIAINNHTSLGMSNHTSLNIANDTHNHNDTIAAGNESSHNHGLSAGYAKIGGNVDEALQFDSNTTDFTGNWHLTPGNDTLVSSGGGGAGTSTDLGGSTDSGSSHSHSITGGVSNDTHDHGFDTNISAHSFSQNISNHSIGTNIDTHTENNPATSAASNDENRPKYYNVVWIFRFK